MYMPFHLQDAVRSQRKASTADPRDGPTYLAHGSTHYMNVYEEDSGWRGSDETRAPSRMQHVGTTSGP